MPSIRSAHDARTLRPAAAASKDTVLEVAGLSIDFATAHGWANVVNDVTFNIGHREILGLVGESGSGKTVTGLAILGLVPMPPGRLSGGHVWFEGQDLLTLPERARRDIRGNDISMIFQEPMTSLNPAFTIGDQISETVLRHRGGSRRAAKRRAIEMLDLVGIPKAVRRVDDYPHEFSGGMRQRAMIAMALSCEPKLLLADEPTTALDVTIQAQILELLVSMRDEIGMSILMITHDLGVVGEICDRVVVMYAGQVVERAPAVELFEKPDMPYTDGLLKAMPQLGPATGKLASIPGHTPEPWNMPVGCRFHPRCSYVEPRCTQGPVEIRPIGPEHMSRCVRSGELKLAGIS